MFLLSHVFLQGDKLAYSDSGSASSSEDISGEGAANDEEKTDAAAADDDALECDMPGCDAVSSVAPVIRLIMYLFPMCAFRL